MFYVMMHLGIVAHDDGAKPTGWLMQERCPVDGFLPRL